MTGALTCRPTLPALNSPAHRAARQDRCFAPIARFVIVKVRWLLLATVALLAIACWSPGPSITAPNVPEIAAVASRRNLAIDAAKPLAPNTERRMSVDISERDARVINDAVPFAPLRGDRPTSFIISPHGPDYQRALDCLASAMLYEAGDDPAGQAAVAQVVLNRVRHPAFPHSVCGVVYQGASRVTGCQFTFTCDGALLRSPSIALWRRARATASAFLAGETAPGVGTATHYHTDWVHPQWSASLEKIARVGPHLFFRWSGRWGREQVFAARYAGHEAIEPKLALLSMAHRPDTATETGTDDTPAPSKLPAETRITETRDGDHFILVEGGGDGSKLALQSLDECHRQSYCKVVGWDQHSLSYGSPNDPVIRTVTFLYVSDKRTGVEIVLWDCTRFNRPAEAQCLSTSNRQWITFQGNLSHAR